MIRQILAATAIMLFAATAQAEARVDINSAGAEQLASMLDGVGEVRAQAIVEYREANGGFDSVDELSAVDGIGEATLEANRDLLVVDSE